MRCICVQTGRLCSTCLPGRQGQCRNRSLSTSSSSDSRQFVSDSGQLISLSVSSPVRCRSSLSNMPEPVILDSPSSQALSVGSSSFSIQSVCFSPRARRHFVELPRPTDSEDPSFTWGSLLVFK